MTSLRYLRIPLALLTLVLAGQIGRAEERSVNERLNKLEAGQQEIFVALARLQSQVEQLSSQIANANVAVATSHYTPTALSFAETSQFSPGGAIQLSDVSACTVSESAHVLAPVRAQVSTDSDLPIFADEEPTNPAPDVAPQPDPQPGIDVQPNAPAPPKSCCCCCVKRHRCRLFRR